MFRISKIALVALLGIGSAQAVQHRLPLAYVPYPITSWFDHTPGTGYETRYDGVNIPSYTSYYEPRHRGTDFGVSLNTPVYVSAKAVSVVSYYNGCPTGSRTDTCPNLLAFGNYAALKHSDGMVSIYAHLNMGTVNLPLSLPIPCGTQIGLSGNSGASSGPHLHFELRYNDLAATSTSYDPFGGIYSTNYWYDWAIVSDPLRAGYTMRYPVTTCQP